MGVLWRGYGNSGCGHTNELCPELGAVAVCHWFIICESEGSIPYEFVAQEALVCLIDFYRVAYDFSGEFHETNTQNNRKRSWERDIVWDYPCKTH